MVLESGTQYLALSHRLSSFPGTLKTAWVAISTDRDAESRHLMKQFMSRGTGRDRCCCHVISTVSPSDIPVGCALVRFNPAVPNLCHWRSTRGAHTWSLLYPQAWDWGVAFLYFPYDVPLVCFTCSAIDCRTGAFMQMFVPVVKGADHRVVPTIVARVTANNQRLASRTTCH